MSSAVVRTAVVAAVGAFLLSASWAMSTPVMLVPDEASHTIRAVSLWQGDLLGDRFELVEEGPPRVEAVNFAVTVPAGYVDLPTQTACFQDPVVSGGCAPTLQARPGQARIGTSAGAYQPLWYVLLGAPSRVLPPVPAIYAARLLQALVGAVFVGLSIGLAARLAGRAGVAVALLGLTPTAVWLLGAVNPNGIEIAAASTLWLGLLALVDRPDSRVVAMIVGVAGTAVAWARPFSPLITAGILAAVGLLTLDRRRGRAAWASRPARWAVTAVVVAIGTSSAWSLASGALDTFIGTPDPGLTPGVAAMRSWSSTQDRLEQMVGRFGLLDIRLPGDVAWLWAAAVLVVALAVVTRITARQAGVLVAIITATVALPVLAESFTAQEYGLTWQGRYSMPVAYGVLAVLVWAVGHGRAGDRPAAPRRRDLLWALPPALVLPAVHVLAYLHVMTRVSVGPDRPLTAYLSAPGFSPPGPDAALLVTLAAGVLTLLATLLPAADRTIVLPDPAALPVATR